MHDGCGIILPHPYPHLAGPVKTLEFRKVGKQRRVGGEVGRQNDPERCPALDSEVHAGFEPAPVSLTCSPLAAGCLSG